MPPGISKILGLEFSGVVEEVGSSDEADPRHKWQKGDEVFGLVYGGAYAEFVCVNKKMIIRKPEKLSFETAAGLCEVYFTALQALHLVGGYTPGQTKSVLWHAGASAVSIAGMQLSLHANDHHEHAHSKLKPSQGYAGFRSASSDKVPSPPRVFATTRQDEKCRHVEQKFGALYCANTVGSSNWVEEIKKHNGDEGIDLIVDFTGASYFQQNLELLARDGRMVILGTLGGVKLPAETDISHFLAKRIRVEGSTLRTRDVEYQGRLRDLFEEHVLPEVLEGGFNPNIERTLSWKEVAQAHQDMEDNKTKGKLVCVVD